jgi:hypothetical protein
VGLDQTQDFLLPAGQWFLAFRQIFSLIFIIHDCNYIQLSGIDKGVSA